MGVRRITLLLVPLLVALLAAPAHAALWMEFEPASGHPGTEVTGRTAGNGAMRAGDGPFPAFLVVVATNERTPIGEVVVDRHDNGTLRFTVPEVPGGKYEIQIHCEPCAPFSAGQTELTVGEFRVLGPKSVAPVSEPTRYPLSLMAILILGCVLLGAMVLRRRARPAGPAIKSR